MDEGIRNSLNNLGRRIFNMFARAIVKRIEDDGLFQVMQLAMQADELKSEIRRLQSYGLTTVPPLGSEALAVFPNGERSTGVVLGVDHGGYRPKGMKPGEVCLYAQHGQVIHLREDGGITFHAAKAGGGWGDIDFRGQNLRFWAEKSLSIDIKGYGWSWEPNGVTTNWTAGATGSTTTKPMQPEEVGAPAPAKPDVPSP
jgi:phage gp45-like